MSLGKHLLAAMVIFTAISSATHAAVIMSSDASNIHNGSLSDGDFGTYWKPTGTGNPPTEWAKTDNHVYNGALFIQAYPNAKIFNNTGETVTVNHEYTLSADLGNRLDAQVDVYVRATQNADGTGAFLDLTHITRTGTDTEGSIALTTVTGTGSAAPASIAGYFIQVLVQTGPNVSGQDAFFDNINVTSEVAVPEPAAMGLLAGGALLALSRRRHASTRRM